MQALAGFPRESAMKSTGIMPWQPCNLPPPTPQFERLGVAGSSSSRSRSLNSDPDGPSVSLGGWNCLWLVALQLSLVKSDTHDSNSAERTTLMQIGLVQSQQTQKVWNQSPNKPLPGQTNIASWQINHDHKPISPSCWNG